MNRTGIFKSFFLSSYCFISTLFSYGQENYMRYHERVIEMEMLLAEKEYAASLENCEALMADYDFVFLREYKVASHLALITGDTAKAKSFIITGIAKGWSMWEIRKNKVLAPLTKGKWWKYVESKLDSLHSVHEKSINRDVRRQVHAMFKKDQKLAIAGLFRIGNKAQERFGTEVFGPHSNGQMKELMSIMDQHGYPGERLIGFNYYMSTILSHHNSASKEYVEKDTLYPGMKARLIQAIWDGEMHPEELALIEDWRWAVLHDHASTQFGFIGTLADERNQIEADLNRTFIRMRSIQLRNELKDVEESTGMNFYLPGGPWQEGKITLSEK